MKQCKNCDRDNKDDSKFCVYCGTKLALSCPSCGTSIPPEAKFCMGCGANISIAPNAGGDNNKEVSSIALAPNPLGLADCPVEIKEVTAESPDHEDDLIITVKYEVRNDTDEDWEHLEIRTQLLSAAGQIIEEYRDAQDQTISAGDSAEFEASFWGLNAKILGSNPEKPHVVVSAIASSFVRQSLGEIAIPEIPYEVVALKPVKIGDVLQLVSGSLWKTAPDDDKDCRVEIKALVQNLTDKHLPQVNLVAEVTDKSGRELTDAGGNDEVRPGNVVVINGSGYAKERKLSCAKTDISIRTYWPVAAGASQRQGMAVTAAKSSESGTPCWSLPTGDDAADRNAYVSEGLLINGGWEGTKCRWFVAWKSVSESEMAGAVAGYSGGGAFQVERFYAKHSEDVLEALWIDFTDRISEEEIDFETLDQEILQVCEQGLDCIWEWNDQDEWSDSDRVVLRGEKTDELETEGDMLMLVADQNPLVRNICEAAGLTAAPSNSSVNNQKEFAMSYEQIIEKYRIDDICPEIDNELNGMFVDILGDEFELGIFPEQSPKNDDSFVVTVEISCDSATLNSDEIKQIQTSVEERLAHNLGKDWKAVQNKFDGVQVIFNEDLMS